MENSELITKALQYIQKESTNGELTLELVAAHAGFSIDYFNKIFFAHTGFSVMEYVRFKRMKEAANLLRCTEKDVLDIALDCGYEAHESFSRAFKKQYGMTPVEYRKKHENRTPTYGDFHNDTVGARLMHEFKGFKIADSTEVIDYLLEADAIKYADTAVLCHWNGGAALYDGEDFRNGFVWFTEWNGQFNGCIVSEDYRKIAEYLKTFSDERFDMTFLTLDDEATVIKSLSEHGISASKINRGFTHVYTGEPYALTAPDGISMRLLKYEDYPLIQKYFEGSKSAANYVSHLEMELHRRDILGNAESNIFDFGIFKDGEMIGFTNGDLMRPNGFVINFNITTNLKPEYKTEELYQYAFKFVTNAALEKGALPIDNCQTPAETSAKSGTFDSTEFGYRLAVCTCSIKK